eukprot:TRINITY_DN41120_c0_g1_i1.p1 TRINITY_DN41120_c0_g1~~TRINITY_DN41120_c0_g1_i1.p1  ORF type:complete len:345 (+),score=60.96 TRINITY_DN41120_c0_g1_i1:30-1064(+)
MSCCGSLRCCCCKSSGSSVFEPCYDSSDDSTSESSDGEARNTRISPPAAPPPALRSSLKKPTQDLSLPSQPRKQIRWESVGGDEFKNSLPRVQTAGSLSIPQGHVSIQSAVPAVPSVPPPIESSSSYLSLSTPAGQSPKEAMAAEAPVAEKADPSQTCPRCGNVYLPQAVFCRQCGLRRETKEGLEVSTQASEEEGPEAAAGELPDGIVNGCGCEYNFKDAERRGALRNDDEIHEFYKADTWWASLAGTTKTMYCHHFTSLSRGGLFAVRAAKNAAMHFASEEEVWKFLGKEPCCGRFSRGWGSEDWTCVACNERSEDNTCTAETCLFVANYLPCPVPAWAHAP